MVKKPICLSVVLPVFRWLSIAEPSFWILPPLVFTTPRLVVITPWFVFSSRRLEKNSPGLVGTSRRVAKTSRRVETSSHRLVGRWVWKETSVPIWGRQIQIFRARIYVFFPFFSVHPFTKWLFLVDFQWFYVWRLRLQSIHTGGEAFTDRSPLQLISVIPLVTCSLSASNASAGRWSLWTLGECFQPQAFTHRMSENEAETPVVWRGEPQKREILRI